MQASIRTHIVAVTAGLVVGIVLQEILLSIFDLLNPAVNLNLAISGMAVDTAWVKWLFLGWWVGGFTAGMMSSMISRSLTTGCIAGVLLMLSALILAHYAFDSAETAALFTINPLIAAALGSWLAGRLLLTANKPSK
ncbi:MAG: hypothetical protein AAF446_09230 [Pseudomonadota bacterium]